MLIGLGASTGNADRKRLVTRDARWRLSAGSHRPDHIGILCLAERGFGSARPATCVPGRPATGVNAERGEHARAGWYVASGPIRSTSSRTVARVTSSNVVTPTRPTGRACRSQGEARPSPPPMCFHILLWRASCLGPHGELSAQPGENSRAACVEAAEVSCELLDAAGAELACVLAVASDPVRDAAPAEPLDAARAS